MSRARLLLADDNAELSAQIRGLLEPAFDVVGVVTCGEDLETATEMLSPEVIVTDIAMPGEGGLVAVQHIKRHHPGARVVFLTVNDTSSMIRLARVRAGRHTHETRESDRDRSAWKETGRGTTTLSVCWSNDFFHNPLYTGPIAEKSATWHDAHTRRRRRYANELN